jgi:RNA polymerase sigma factor (sigma-70 family)
LVQLYSHHIRRVVRKKLHQKIRSKFDSDDFAQAVWASFFALQPTQHDFTDPDRLLAFLVNMARNKVIDAIRQRFQSLKYDVNREHSLDGSAAYKAAALPARQPTPSQVVAAREEWDLLRARLEPRDQRILDLRLEGYTYGQIAEQVGVDEKTVRRVLQKLEGGA